MFAAPIEELRPLISEPVYFRRGLSAFANPGFADELSAAEGEEVFLVGFSLPDSCLATALAGHDHGVAFTLIEDAVGTGDAPADAATALRESAIQRAARNARAGAGAVISGGALSTIARRGAAGAPPAMLSIAARPATMTFETGDPDSEELKRLLEACVDGPYRLRLHDQLRAIGGCEHT
jgi:hypothetical protein